MARKSSSRNLKQLVPSYPQAGSREPWMHVAAQFCFPTNVIQDPLVSAPTMNRSSHIISHGSSQREAYLSDDFRFHLANDNTNHHTQRILVLIMKLMIKRIERWFWRLCLGSDTFVGRGKVGGGTSFCQFILSTYTFYFPYVLIAGVSVHSR